MPPSEHQNKPPPAPVSPRTAGTEAIQAVLPGLSPPHQISIINALVDWSSLDEETGIADGEAWLASTTIRAPSLGGPGASGPKLTLRSAATSDYERIATTFERLSHKALRDPLVNRELLWAKAVKHLQSGCPEGRNTCAAVIGARLIALACGYEPPDKHEDTIQYREGTFAASWKAEHAFEVWDQPRYISNTTYFSYECSDWERKSPKCLLANCIARGLTTGVNMHVFNAEEGWDKASSTPAEDGTWDTEFPEQPEQPAGGGEAPAALQPDQAMAEKLKAVDVDSLREGALVALRHWISQWKGTGCVHLAYMMAVTNTFTSIAGGGRGEGRKMNWLMVQENLVTYGGHYSPLVDWAAKYDLIGKDPSTERVVFPTTMGALCSQLATLSTGFTMIHDRVLACTVQASPDNYVIGTVLAGANAEELASAHALQQELLDIHMVPFSEVGMCYGPIQMSDLSEEAADAYSWPRNAFADLQTPQRVPVFYWSSLFPGLPYCLSRETPAMLRTSIPRSNGEGPRCQVVRLGQDDVVSGSPLLLPMGTSGGVTPATLWVQSGQEWLQLRVASLAYLDGTRARRTQQIATWATLPVVDMRRDRNPSYYLDAPVFVQPGQLAPYVALCDPLDVASMDQQRRKRLVSSVMSESFLAFRAPGGIPDQ